MNLSQINLGKITNQDPATGTPAGGTNPPITPPAPQEKPREHNKIHVTPKQAPRP